MTFDDDQEDPPYEEVWLHPSEVDGEDKDKKDKDKKDKKDKGKGDKK